MVIELAKVERGWERLIKFDFPASLILVALAWHDDRPLLWFGVGGTLWWYVVSWAALRLLSTRNRQHVKTGGA